MLFLYYAPNSEALNQGQGEGLATFVCWSHRIKAESQLVSAHDHYHFVNVKNLKHKAD